MLKRIRNEVVLRIKDFKPSDPRLNVIGVFNPGVALLKKDIILLVRVAEAPAVQKPDFLAAIEVHTINGKPNYKIEQLPEKRTNRLPHISHLQVVRMSRDGFKIKSVETRPDLFGSNENENYGIEDPRITQIGQTYYITYVSVGRLQNVCTSLMSTTDFKTFKRHGVIFPCENKDVVLHPAKFGGRYVAYHRAVGCLRFTPPSIISAMSNNLDYWGDSKSFMLAGPHPTWDSVRIGAGAPPIKTKKGWLQMYHGVSGEGKMREYSAGAVLTSLTNPLKPIARSKTALLRPINEFEINGYISKVVFPTGWVQDPQNRDHVILYYGCADTHIAAVTLSIEEILSQLSPC